MARSAPLGPEVDEHRNLGRPRDDVVGRTSPRSRPRCSALPETTTSAAQPAISAAVTCSGRDAGERPVTEIDRRSAARSSSCRARAPSVDPISSSSAVESMPRRPVWRRAMPSSSRSSSSGSIRMFESDPMQSGIDRSRTAETRRKPSPRSASVVGHAQMRAPAAARRSSSSSLACVAWMIVVRAVRQPVSARSSIGRQPCSARHSSISRGCSSAWMCSGSRSLVA